MRNTFLVIFCLIQSCLFAQTTAFDAVQKLISDSDLMNGQTGIVVLDAQSGSILAQHNANMSLIPASNMKIVTTGAALKLLGADFQYRTDLQYDGTIKDSVLTGNIYIKGYGDPTLGSPFMDYVPRMQTVLDSFVANIKALGINKIQGKIIGDASGFENATATRTWLWEDLGQYYGVGPSALNFNENSYRLYFTQNPNENTPPSVSGLSPEVPEFRIINEVLCKGKTDDSYIYSVPESQVGIVRGYIPNGTGSFDIKGALPDPPLFAAWHLRRSLRERGIEVTDSATTNVRLERISFEFRNRETFFTWRSPPFLSIVRQANTESVNLYCEAFVRTLALHATGLGTNDKGVELIQNFWQSKGINTKGLFMQDGSGLSPRNGITPLQLTQMLQVIAQDSVWFSQFYSTLPIPAKTGTLSGMFKKDTEAQMRLRAKSGTLTRVKSYSGYVRTRDGRLIAFSVVCNNFTCSQRDIRKKLETFMSELCRL